MYFQKKKYKLFRLILPAYTMVELLIVMLVAGIVFLMAFEGLNVVRQYSGLIHRKLMEKSTLLYGHQVLEALMEQSDSIRKCDQRVIFYSNATDTIENSLIIDSASISLSKGAYIDVLFPNPVFVDFCFLDEKTGLIDSIFIVVKSGKDTLRFDYGLSSLHNTKFNIISEQVQYE